MDQNIDSFGFDQIQTPQYPVIHPPSQEMSEEVFQHAQPDDMNELFQKLLEDLQIINEELAEYIDSPSWNRPTFFNDHEEHSVQYKEYLESSSNTIVASNFNQEKEGQPQDSDIRQLVRKECGINVSEKQKQNMEDTLQELIEVCQQKEFSCMHNNVDDLIESALNSKLLSINLKSQRLDKKKQEVKNISLVHAITPVLPTEEPKYSLSMGYEHLSTTPETKSDEVIKYSVEKLVSIPSEYEVTFVNKNYDDDAFEDIEYVEATPPDSELKLLSINRLIADIESLNGNHTPDFVLKSSFPIFEESDNSLSYSDNSLPELETFRDHTEEMRSGNTTTHANNSFLEYDSFCFEIEPDQERLTNVVKNNISDNSTNDPLLKEVDLFLASDNSIPPGMENIDYDSEGDIHFLEELLVDDSISLPENESSDFDYQDDPSFPRPPLEPPDVEFFFNLEPNSG
nr:hypothetical protein [Tanacetum cinerariifolium]